MSTLNSLKVPTKHCECWRNSLIFTSVFHGLTNKTFHKFIASIYPVLFNFQVMHCTFTGASCVTQRDSYINSVCKLEQYKLINHFWQSHS